jgi:SAM-dependent methyltransferase
MIPEGLVCPRDRLPVRLAEEKLCCPDGHVYPVVEGIPVMLIAEERPTHRSIPRSLELVESGTTPSYNDEGSNIDPVVQDVIQATCGNLYKHMLGRVVEYPIPEIRLPEGHGERFLELGCNWGRWCVSAARRGYTVVGIDPSLEGVLAAKRVAANLGVDAQYVVADARHVPFADSSFDVVFSYSVLQHFSKDDARSALAETGRLLRPGGTALIQLANRFGLRSTYNRVRLAFAEPKIFDVRYWTPGELEAAFTSLIGPAELEVDGFFSLNAQLSDARLLSRSGRVIVYTSEVLRRVAEVVTPLRSVADSLYVRASRSR